jgi:hypothetical protein
MLRRLHAKYASRGLRIIVTQRMAGYTDWNGSGTLTEAEEAEFARWYFGDYHKLPATLAVQATAFGKGADGRRVASQAPSTTLSSVLSSPLIGTKLVDRAGVLRYASIGIAGEKELEAYIESALAR